MKKRYISPQSQYHVKGISEMYSSDQYKFYSSSSDRTLMSGYSFSKALFPIGRKIDIAPYNFALPNGSTPVPYFTLEGDNDRIFYEYDNCRPLVFKIVEFFASHEGIKIVHDYMSLTNKIAVATGLNFTLPFIDQVTDIARILDDHQLLKDECEPIKNVLDLMKVCWKELNKIAYQRKIVGKLVGGYLMQQVLSQMESGRKFIHYSGHDSTILNSLSAMYLFEDNEDLFEQPLFGSAVIWEVIEKNSTKFVRIGYQMGYNGNINYYPLKSFGCLNELCEFEIFKKELNEKSFVTNEEWCKECLNFDDEKCKKSY